MSTQASMFYRAGSQTLEVIAESGNFNKWMYSQIKPFLHGKVLEIGSGIGNISQFLLADKFNTTVSDIEPSYIESLSRKFSQTPFFEGVQHIDLTQLTTQENAYDTIIAINVVEHIENETIALRNIYRMLRSGGTAIILVPAYQFLFCNFDHQLGHYRRYTKLSLQKSLKSVGFSVTYMQYFNLLGVVGWLLFGKLLQRPLIRKNEMWLFDRLVPLGKLADQLVAHRTGLSVIGIVKKP